jgi:predicted RNA binding protein YcfA (HicA-like mRNA interferase family)
MTDYFPDLNSKQIIKIIEKLGFEFVRQSGTSHAVYGRVKDSRKTTIPVHGRKSLKRKTVKAVCKDIGLTIDELKNYLK